MKSPAEKSPDNSSVGTVVVEGALRKSAINSSKWSTAGFGLAQVVRLIGNITLAALLFPEAFALMAICATIVSGIAMLTDIGLGPNIVQSKRGDDPEFLNTAWTIQVLRGVILAILVAAMAWPVAAFYASNDPLAWELLGILPLVALGVFIDAFQSIQMRTATRHLRIGRVTLIQLASQCTGIGVMLIIAWQTQSIYAMALGGLVISIVQCALSHWVLPGFASRFRWEKEAVSEIIYFGKWIVASTAIFFFANQIDKLVFAKFFSLAEVGVYSIASSLALMPSVLMGKLHGAVVSPLYSRMLDRGDTLRNAVNRTKLPILILAAYIFTLTIACAASFIDLAYDRSYALAGQYLPILGTGAWFGIVGSTYTSAFMAAGMPRWVAIVSGARLMIFCALIWPAIHWGGLWGAVIVMGLTDALKLPIVFAFAKKLKLLDLKAESWLTLYCFTIGMVVFWISKIIVEQWAVKPKWMLAAEFLMVSLAFIPLLIKAIGVIKPR